MNTTAILVAIALTGPVVTMVFTIVNERRMSRKERFTSIEVDAQRTRGEVDALRMEMAALKVHVQDCESRAQAYMREKIDLLQEIRELRTDLEKKP